jgi:hypothetical protein
MELATTKINKGISNMDEMEEPTVRVGVTGLIFYGPHVITPATRWDVTNKGTLLVFNDQEEVARYKPGVWLWVRAI